MHIVVIGRIILRPHAQTRVARRLADRDDHGTVRRGDRLSSPWRGADQFETPRALSRDRAASAASVGKWAVRRELGETPYAAPFALAETVNALPPTRGNRARLSNDSNSAIREMVEDIDAAESTVHLCFYIWLADHNGFRIKDALIRAAERGVKVRVLADALGSRGFIRSAYWIELGNAGVDARIALPIGGLIWTLIRGRFDLRNHRKQLIVDNRIAWCGSQIWPTPNFA